jgi:hypothetical protein
LSICPLDKQRDKQSNEFALSHAISASTSGCFASALPLRLVLRLRLATSRRSDASGPERGHGVEPRLGFTLERLGQSSDDVINRSRL